MTDVYLHGIETIERNNGPRPVRTIDTGVIGIVGTAPLANATLFPLNTPVAIYSWSGVEGIGATGTLPDAIGDILSEAGRASQVIVVVRVAEGGTAQETLANLLGNVLNKTGVHALRNAFPLLGLKPKILIAPGFTSSRPTNGITAIPVSAAGTGYTSDPTVTITGTGVGAQAVAVRSTNGGIAQIVVTNPGSGYTGTPTVAITGGGGSGATAGTVTLGTTANPATVELLSVAARLRAVVVKDGPDTTTTAAITDRGDYDTDRLYIIDPKVTKFVSGAPVNSPGSSFVAGLMARIDYEKGFWVSPSNHVIKKAVGASRLVDHSLNDPSVESQQLNRNGIACVVRSPSGGWKLWGNEVPTSDSLKRFLSVRRSHDTIIESIEIACEPFIGKPFSLQVLTDIAETVNNALRRWKALGATLGGRVWLDPTLNTAETWAAGKLFISYDAEAPAPIQQITFVFNRNTGYYTELAERAVDEINRIVNLQTA